MSNDCIPYYDDGDELTVVVTAAVTGKTAVKISGNLAVDSTGLTAGLIQCAPAGAGDFVFGIAMYDQPTVGKTVRIQRIVSGLIVPVTLASAVTAGQPVKVAAGGQANASTVGSGDKCFGYACTGGASAADGMIALERIIA